MSLDPSSLARRVASETGLAFDGRAAVSSLGVTAVALTPAGHQASQTFSLVIVPGWRSLEVHFDQGAFSGDLVAEMGHADDTGRQSFLGVLAACAAEGATVDLTVNGLRV